MEANPTRSKSIPSIPRRERQSRAILSELWRRGGDIVNYDVPTVSLSSLIEEYGKAHFISNRYRRDGRRGDCEPLAVSGSTIHFDRTPIIAAKTGETDSHFASPWLDAVPDGDQSTVTSQVHPTLAIALGPSGLFGDELPQAWVTDISAITAAPGSPFERALGEFQVFLPSLFVVAGSIFMGRESNPKPARCRFS